MVTLRLSSPVLLQANFRGNDHEGNMCHSYFHANFSEDSEKEPFSSDLLDVSRRNPFSTQNTYEYLCAAFFLRGCQKYSASVRLIWLHNYLPVLALEFSKINLRVYTLCHLV